MNMTDIENEKEIENIIKEIPLDKTKVNSNHLFNEAVNIQQVIYLPLKDKYKAIYDIREENKELLRKMLRLYNELFSNFTNKRVVIAKIVGDDKDRANYRNNLIVYISV